MKTLFKKLLSSKTQSKHFSETVQRVGKNNAGFSLVELIVVIAIMAILATVAVIGVSVYIPKAQQAGDEQTINDIKKAFELHAYQEPNAVDYVILTTSGATAKEGGFADSALTATFGEGWEDELKLQYKEWASSNSMLSEALNATNVSGSSYIQNSSVTELLGNVQDVTSAAAGLLGSVSKSKNQYLTLLEASMGTAYMEKAVASGVITKTEAGEYDLIPGTYTDNGTSITISSELQNQLSNLMVFGVASDMEQISNQDMANMMISGVFPEDIDVSGQNTATVMAAQYAFYKAFAADMGGDVEKSFNKMNDDMQNVNSATEARALLDGFVATNQTALTEYLSREDSEEKLLNNASAVTQIMGGVNATAPNYSSSDALNNSSLFTSDSVSGDLNVFVGMASVELTPEQRTELQGVLTNNPNAVVILINNGQIIATIDN